MIARGEPLHSTLRLACLLSLVSNGLRPKALASLQAGRTLAHPCTPSHTRAPPCTP